MTRMNLCKSVGLLFVVHAKGNSMLPKIKDGDLCVFERYHGGSREGEIVLSQVNEYYEEYGGKYTIKKFHSEKTVNEEGGGKFIQKYNCRHSIKMASKP